MTRPARSGLIRLRFAELKPTAFVVSPFHVHPVRSWEGAEDYVVVVD
jgi:hypothetical protein